MNAIPIWQPRYHDRKVLVDCDKVDEDEDTFIFFCGDENLPNLYKVDSIKVVNECDVTTNGSIFCFEIPLEWLEDVGKLPDNLLDKKEKELAKFKKFNTYK